LPQLQVDPAHSAVQTLPSSQFASHGGVAHVKAQVAPPVQLHTAPQSPLVDVVLLELVVVVMPPMPPVPADPPVLAPCPPLAPAPLPPALALPTPPAWPVLPPAAS
jgi:hypothetical protein